MERGSHNGSRAHTPTEGREQAAAAIDATKEKAEELKNKASGMYFINI